MSKENEPPQPIEVLPAELSQEEFTGMLALMTTLAWNINIKARPTEHKTVIVEPVFDTDIQREMKKH